MEKAKKYIINLFNSIFRAPKDGENKKLRRLVIDKKTGKINWSEGEKRFEDEDLNAIEIENTFHLEDDKEKGITVPHFKLPAEHTSCEVFRKNRFMIEFPGIPAWHFSSYKYIGHDQQNRSQKKLLTSGVRNIEYDYSSFVFNIYIGGEVDICDKMNELEENPKIGDIKIHMLDPTGVRLRTIVIPKCEVAEIKAFRDLDYADDDTLKGEIIVKHKQRKLL